MWREARTRLCWPTQSAGLASSITCHERWAADYSSQSLKALIDGALQPTMSALTAVPQLSAAQKLVLACIKALGRDVFVGGAV